MRTELAQARDADGGFTLVELLVAITIMGMIAASITSVVMSTLRVEQNQASIQEVVNDGRNSLHAIRRELRAARRVHEGSDGGSLRFWLDQDQDQIPSADEEICYLVQAIGPGQWQIVRWTHAVAPQHCVSGATAPAGASSRVVARTLVDPEPFASYDPVPGGPTDPATREVAIRLVLEVVGARDSGQTTVEGAVRLRNVP